MSDLLDTCRRLALTVAPEARLITFADAADYQDLPADHGCLGWADPDLGAVAIDFAALADLGGDIAANVGAVAVHELAHVLPVAPPPPVEIPAAERPAILQRRARMILTDDDPDAEADCHDWRFLRRTCHLAGRASAAGFAINPRRLWTLSNLSWPPHYVAELVGEIIRMRSATFAEIEETPPPPGFMQLWESDQQLWRSNA